MYRNFSGKLFQNLDKFTLNRSNLYKLSTTSVTAGRLLNNTNNNSVRSLASKLLVEGNGGKKIVGYWLAGTSAAVFGIIVFGGLTRLTESGLSMVDWKLIHFSAPKNESEWEAYFEKYKEFPEYKL